MGRSAGGTCDLIRTWSKKKASVRHVPELRLGSLSAAARKVSNVRIWMKADQDGPSGDRILRGGDGQCDSQRK